jgi:hypothetical protein
MEQRALAGYLMQFALPVGGLDGPEGRRAIDHALFVWGVSHTGEGASLFFGLDRLREVAGGRVAAFDAEAFGPPEAAAFVVDYATDEPELLAAACDDIKGENCYAEWCKCGGR